MSITKVLIAPRSRSNEWILISICLTNLLRNFIHHLVNLETGTSKFTAPSSLGPRTFLHGINTSGRKKLDLYSKNSWHLCHKVRNVKSWYISEIIIAISCFCKILQLICLTGFWIWFLFWIYQGFEYAWIIPEYVWLCPIVAECARICVKEPTIMFIIFWEFLMAEQIFPSPQMKQMWLLVINWHIRFVSRVAEQPKM